MKISPRAEVFIAIGIIVVVALVMIFALIVPQFGAMTEQDRQLAAANKDIQSAENLLAQRQSAKSRAAQTQTELMQLENEVPDDPQLPSLIIELQNTANAAGLDFVKITPASPVAKAGYSTVPIAVLLNGRWADCVDYVYRLERLDRKVRVVSVKLAPLVNPSAAIEATNTDIDRNPPVDLAATIQLEAYTISGGAPTQGAVPPAPVSTP